MKLKQSKECIELSNGLVKLFFGILLAIMIPILYVLCVFDLFQSSFQNIDWIDTLFMIGGPIAYCMWFFFEFRKTVLRYKIVLDDKGIIEKRFLCMDRIILWDDLEEYLCESAPSPGKERINYYTITFSSKQNQIVIQTWSFPEKKLHFIRDAVFDFCERHQRNM